MLDRSDRQPLALLAPAFAITAAAAIVGSSAAKALFLDANELSILPALFLASAAFTALASMLYVAAIKRAPLELRYPVLIAIAALVFIGLRATYPASPKILSIVIFVLIPGIGYLLTLQTWTMAAYLLPTRQGKRLFPVLAAAATMGAAIGGAMVKGLLSWRSAEDLVALAAVLLLIPLLTVRGTIRRLRKILREKAEAEDKTGSDADTEAGDPAQAETSPENLHQGEDTVATLAEREERDKSSGVIAGFSAIGRSPLLWRLAVFVFFMQGASVLVDYQFSGELKANFGKNDIASFLGSFYMVSNAVVVLLSLFVTGRAVRILGIGLSLSIGAIAVGIGSSLYIVSATTGLMPSFWAMAGTMFLLHVGQYAMTRNSRQMLVTPLDTEEGERARTLIDGVIYRVATITVSIVLLIAAPSVAKLYVLSPAVILASAIVVFLGLRIGPHYRTVLFEALRARKLADTTTSALSRGLGRKATTEIEDKLQSNDNAAVRNALDVIAELNLPIRPELLEALSRFAEDDIAERALATLKRMGHPLRRDLLANVLQAHRGAGVLKEALHVLNQHVDPELLDVVRPLSRHADPTVASLASLFRIRAEHEHGTQFFQAVIDDEASDADLKSPKPDARALLDGVARREERRAKVRQSRSSAGDVSGIPAFETTGRRAVDYARELFSLIEADSSEVRANAVATMGRMRLPMFIDPLISCLLDRGLRQAAITALVSFGPAALDRIAERLADKALATNVRVSLYTVLEGIRNERAVEILVEQSGANSMAVRNEAVLTLWRIDRLRDGPVIAKKEVRGRALEELERLKRYAALEKSIEAVGLFRSFFLEELDAARVQAETRVFLLLGMLYDRAALYRAWLHYRSTQQRTRSNAIELLDQHVGDPDLKAFVGLIEREEVQGDQRMRTVAMRRLVPDGSIEDLLSEVEPWLRRLWSWTISRERKPAQAFDWLNVLDRVFQLSSVPLFKSMSGEQLVTLAQRSERRDVADGELLFDEGDFGHYLYLIQRGRIEIVRSGQLVATLGPREVVGELAILDGIGRSAAARAKGEVAVVEVTQDAFKDLMDIHASLGHGVIAVLANRLRSLTEGLGGQ